MSQRAAWCLMVVLLLGCSGPGGGDADIRNMDWSEIEFTARGSLVRFYMDGGQPGVNHWIDTPVAEELKRLYDITLVRVPLDAQVVVAKLVAEKGSGMNVGGVDLFQVSGEDFHTARQAGVLFGPFAERLPGFVRYVDKSLAATDGGYPVDGFEVPLADGHFVAIPASAPNKAGAMVVANYLLLPEALAARR